MRLDESLKELNRYPFHMPGHKRNPKFGIPGAEIDITEIDGFDNLHDAHGMIRDIEDRLSHIYKSKKSFMLVGGSTVGILSAIFAVCDEGDKIIIARNCHKSVYNACLLRKLNVVFLEPEFDTVNCYYTGIRQETLNRLLAKHGDAKAVVITSPTYEGRLSNLKSSASLIVDAAHGAHLGISHFPAYPKGSIVISSLHKTLPALTQTAVANVYDSEYTDKMKFYLDIFETSSPSYLLMNSVSVCCNIIENQSDLFREYYKRLTDFRQIELYALQLKYSDDISKIVISTENTKLSGTELANILRKQYHIEPEMASLNYIVLITSIGDEQEAFDKLSSALQEIDSTLITTHAHPLKRPPVPQEPFVIAVPRQTKAYGLTEAIGKTAAEFVYAYPPDIPLLSPNEPITKETVDYIRLLTDKGVTVISDSGLLPNKILTKAEE